MSDEMWGAWQRHDGKGCPCAGAFVQVEMSDGDVDAAMWDEFCWEYSELGAFFEGYITRFRIRKPRGLTILENLIAEIPEEVAG